MIDGPEYLRGRTNEFVVMSLLVVSERWAVVPNAEMTGRSGGRAPVLYQVHVNTPLADFDTIKCGVRVSVEAKLKTKAVPYGKTGRDRHGIDQKSFDSYLRLQEMSKTPVVLCITEEQTGDILANTLVGLGEADPSTSDLDRKVYWDRECFRPMWSIDPGRLATVMYLNGQPRTLPDFTDNDEAMRTMEKVVSFLRPKQAEFQLGHYDILAAEAVLNLSVPRHVTKKARRRLG